MNADQEKASAPTLKKNHNSQHLRDMTMVCGNTGIAREVTKEDVKYLGGRKDMRYLGERNPFSPDDDSSSSSSSSSSATSNEKGGKYQPEDNKTNWRNWRERGEDWREWEQKKED